ncbi:hypothetical protein HO133_000032 [Letharia lupina]|uniref:Fido domain-containing protein n=1 Tax=Letharia lupina TaxID=560253 RepID=A0A8H6L0A8_9LECA|nr:uncharacterized protein HO133_000032 [Letharia lupina]KAF6230773.1 hypothetical protein HO133_000032 [Letharia lupina]
MALVLRFLKPYQVKALNKLVEKGASFVHSEAMLESAIYSPSNHQHYSKENDLATLAAVQSCALIKNHPFLNGNKRTALLAANLFLLQNGKALQRDPYRAEANDSITQAHGQIAEGNMDHAAVADVYRACMTAATTVDLTQAASLIEDENKPPSDSQK